MNLSPQSAVFHQMKAVAKEAAGRAYVPYSHFPVGAAVLLKNGEIVPGCNVENSSYGLTNCAERSALFGAISRGISPKDFAGVVIYMPGQTLYSPCGACRQVLNEFLEPDDVVIATCDSEATRQWTMAALLPDSFAEFVPVD